MNKTKKTLLLSIVFSVGLLLPLGINAQNGGGLFGLGSTAESTNNNGMPDRSIPIQGLLDLYPFLMSRGSTGGYIVSTEWFGSSTNGGFQIGTEHFGQDAPLGSGLIILAAVGAAYAFKKRKMNK
jgi:hypothetical protein